jgi:hypothetical protein
MYTIWYFQPRRASRYKGRATKPRGLSSYILNSNPYRLEVEGQPCGCNQANLIRSDRGMILVVIEHGEVRSGCF